MSFRRSLPEQAVSWRLIREVGTDASPIDIGAVCSYGMRCRSGDRVERVEMTVQLRTGVQTFP